MRENLQIRLLAGERVDPSDVLKLDDALKQYLPQGKPIAVEITIVNPDPQPEPPPSAPPPTETKPSPLASSAPTNVVELPRPRSAGELITDTMRRFNQLRGYGVAPDGGWVEAIHHAAANGLVKEQHT